MSFGTLSVRKIINGHGYPVMELADFEVGETQVDTNHLFFKAGHTPIEKGAKIFLETRSFTQHSHGLLVFDTEKYYVYEWLEENLPYLYRHLGKDFVLDLESRRKFPLTGMMYMKLRPGERSRVLPD